MALNGVIVYFPWGGAGNLIKNIINLDTRFDFIDDREFDGEYPTTEGRYHWLLDYYQKPMTPELWLPREWSIRAKMHARYYADHKIVYWNPDALVAYDIHGERSEIDGILDNVHLKHRDQTSIARGEKVEQLSSWKLIDCEHVFLLPKDNTLITEIYNSKNPSLNQLDGDLSQKQSEAQDSNQAMTARLRELQVQFDTNKIKYHTYVADDLYRDTGAEIILDIMAKLDLTIPDEYVKMIHSVWLSGTRTVYKKYFNRDLII